MRSTRRAFMVGLDVTRAVGPRAAARILDQDKRRRRLGEVPRDRVYDRLWRQAAGSVGARVTPLDGSLLEIARENVRTRVQHQYTDLDGSATLRVAADKPVVSRLLEQAGLPVPEHVAFRADDITEARKFLAETGNVVIKPAGSTGGGFGVSAHIASERDLDQAVRRVARTQTQVVMERQVPGTVHRVLLLESGLLDVLRRHAPRVVGDGVSSIFELMLAENERRLTLQGEAGIDLLRVDLDCLTTLRVRGRTLNDVPAAGEVEVVKTVTNQNCASDNESLGRSISPALLHDCIAAARITGVRLAGVDVITSDAGRPLSETGGAIIEVNAAPGLHHHYHVAAPSDTTDVAVPVLERLLNSCGGTEVGGDSGR